MKRRLITALLALTLALPLSAPALASQIGGRLLPAIRSGSGFPDTDGTVWAEAVEPVYETGLMDGWYQGDFLPQSDGNGRPVLLQHLGNAAAHRAEAQYRDLCHACALSPP